MQAGASVEFVNPPNYGGRPELYPDEIPFCQPGQFVQRLVVTHDPGSPSIFLAHDPRSPLEGNEIDPPADSLPWLKNHLAEVNAAGLCQWQIWDSPRQYGLYLLLRDNPFSYGQPGQQGDSARPPQNFEDANASPDNPQEGHADRFVQCSITDADIEPILREANKASIQMEWLREAARHPYVRQEALDLAGDLIMDLRLWDINEIQSRALEDIATLAVGNGLSEDEFKTIGYDVTSMAIGIEEFLYGLASIVSLRVAQRLHRENIQSGGISDDFDNFAESMEEDLLNGTIGLSIFDAGDYSKELGVNVGGAYNAGSNQIKFAPLKEDFSIMFLFELSIHELYHAYDHKMGRGNTVIESETEAYKRSEKAYILLTQSYGIDRETAFNARFQDMQADAWDEYMTLKMSQLRCLNYLPDWFINRRTDFGDRARENLIMWFHSIDRELMGFNSSGTDSFFKEYYKYVMYTSYEPTIEQYAQNWNIVKQFPEDDLKETANNADKFTAAHLTGPRRSFYATIPQTAERALAAAGYLREYSTVATMAYGISYNLWFGILVNHQRRDMEALADSLPYIPKYDGRD